MRSSIADIAPAGVPAQSTSPAQPAIAVMRYALFVAILLLAWVSVNPFASLADVKLLAVGDTSDSLNQIAYVAVGTGVAVYFLLHDRRALQPLWRPTYLAMMVWLLVSVVASDHPAVSARRVAFVAFVIALAAATPLLPTNLRRFCDLIAAAVLAIIALCFAGILILPELSIHQANDVVEPLLAGSWRGLFPHKNIAGAMMATFVFIGMFIARKRSAFIGCVIVAAAATFLVLSEAKAAMALLPLILILSWACLHARSLVARVTILLVALVGLNLATVGSLYIDAIKSFNEAALPDPSFTGRTDIWQFAIDHILQRPWFGHGFGAFWETDETFFAAELNSNGLAGVSHAHNAFLDLALTVGIPGLFLGCLWTVVAPVRDVHRCINVGADPALTELFLRIWLFGLYTCSFENVLFDRGNPLWFTMLVAMFGMRCLSVRQLVR